MPILFSVVARGPIILAKHAACTGNFEEVTEKILVKIPPHNDKLTYSQGPYLFHYICEDCLIYMCITDDVCIQHMYIYMYIVVKRKYHSKNYLKIILYSRLFSFVKLEYILKL